MSLHNDQKGKGFRVNIGLSVVGIQIYLPLTSRYMLAAFCSSILKNFRTKVEEQRRLVRQVQATVVLSSHPITRAQKAELDDQLASLKASLESLQGFLAATRDGTPLFASHGNMDFYNTMQVEYAREFVVCEQGDFDLAKRFVKNEGAGRGGLKVTVG